MEGTHKTRSGEGLLSFHALSQHLRVFNSLIALPTPSYEVFMEIPLHKNNLLKH